MSKRKPVSIACPICRQRTEGMTIDHAIYCDKCGAAIGHVRYPVKS